MRFYLLGLLAVLGNTAIASEEAHDRTTESSQSPLMQICAQDSNGSCLASNFDAGLKLAETGDAPTANLLYAALVGCGSVAAINVGERVKPAVRNGQQYVASTNELNVQTGNDAKNAEIVRQHFQVKQAKCAVFSDAQLAAYPWLEARAVQNGNSQAIMNMYHHLKAADGNVSLTREEFLSAVEQNANGEHPFNLYLLSKIYSLGDISSVDFKKAYTFGVAYTKAEKDASRRASVHLSRLSAHLTASEKFEAENAATAAAGS